MRKTFRELAEESAQKALAREVAWREANERLAASGEAEGIELTEWGPLAGQVADAASTLHALKKPGTREGNPLLVGLVQKPRAFLAVKVGLGLAINRGIDRLNDEAGRLRLAGENKAAQRRERASKVASTVLTLLGVGPAINNVLVARKR